MNLLLPYDIAGKSKNALKRSIEIAKQFNGLLKILHIYWDPVVREFDKTEVRDRYSYQVLSKIKPELDRSKVRYELLSKRDANFANSVLNTAKDENVDLIVLGKEGFNNYSMERLQSIILSDKVVLLA
jgi:nucleotide-binding universal stress UspA family protein